VFQVLKAIICRQHTVVFLGTANPYYVRFAQNGTTSVLAYAMSQTPTFFSHGLEIMMFWVMQQLVEMEQIHTLCRWQVLVLMRHDAL
jgi:hypothetical protein